MNYFKITYQVFGLPMDLYYQCEAKSEVQAREMFHAKCHGQIVKVEQVEFAKGQVYARPE